MRNLRTKIGVNGRVVIPADYRKALGIKSGDEVLLRLENGAVRITSLARAVRRAKAAVRRYAGGESLSERLIADRRSEARRG